MDINGLADLVDIIFFIRHWVGYVEKHTLCLDVPPAWGVHPYQNRDISGFGTPPPKCFLGFR